MTENRPRNRTKLYYVWCAMKQRCHNPSNKDFKWYGGRGIGICEEWEIFDNFRCWANTSGYSEGLTIDRIDTNGDYSPANCRWITIQRQQRNRRSCRNITHNGETHCMTEWAEITGVKRETIRDRIDRKGWGIPEALFTPVTPNADF